VRFNFTTLIVKWIVNTFALFLVVRTVQGLNLSYTGFRGLYTLALAAAVIGLINTFIRPVIIFLTLPINVLSFGLFTLVINGVIFFATGWLVKGFEVRSFWGAIVGSLLFSLVSLISGLFIKMSDEKKTKVEYRIID
jgi:putative membrane protein